RAGAVPRAGRAPGRRRCHGADGARGLSVGARAVRHRGPRGGDGARLSRGRARMSRAVAIAFWTAVGVASYPWLVYPLLLAARARRRPPVAPAPDAWPSLSVIVAAHNEAACIRAKLASALDDGYPRDRIEVIVVSDASTDDTDRIVAGYCDPRV